MRGRYLLGLSNANRQASGIATGDEVELDVEYDADPSAGSPLTVTNPLSFPPM